MITTHEVVKAGDRETYLGHNQPLGVTFKERWTMIVLKNGVHPVICKKRPEQTIV